MFNSVENAWVIKIPNDFSFLTNPNEAIDVLKSLVEVSTKNPRELIFDHSDCVKIDLCASTAFDIIALGLRAEWAMSGKFHLRGLFPRNENALAIIKSMGITHHLNIRGAEPVPAVDQLFLKFELIRGRKAKAKRPACSSDQERAASALAKYLNQCFETAAGFSFKKEGTRQIVSWAGEIITNAEEHSDQGEWYVMAFMKPIAVGNQTPQNEPSIIGECQMVILNVGRSIHESLSSSTTPNDTHEQIQELVTKHSAKKYFLEPRYSPEDLWTLYALQDGVSRFSPTPGKTDRGKGTVRMIQAFQTLGDTLDVNHAPVMALVSGTSRIKFTKKYKMMAVEMEGGSRQIIAFNATNSLDERPDGEHVHSLEGKFPGTLLSFNFFIDKKYLETKIAKLNDKVK